MTESGKTTRLIAIGGSLFGTLCLLLSKQSKLVELAIGIFFLGIVLAFGMLQEVGVRKLRNRVARSVNKIPP